MVDERINRVLTQYRESPNLLFLLRTYLGKVAEAYNEVCELPDRFDLDTATGDQLTLLGKRMGWPRSHCVCDVEPVFGFDCDDQIDLRPLTGFCEPGSDWIDCSSGLSEITLLDDEIYRRFLKVRAYQMAGKFDHESLEEAARAFFGPLAQVLYSGQGRVVIAPGRDLSTIEIAQLQLYPRVMPVALGIRVMFHFGDLRVFGFGEGWGGLCEPVRDLNNPTGKIFGFNCEGELDETIGGFCEEWLPNGAQRAVSRLDDLVTGDDDDRVTGPMTLGAHWECRVGAPWMCEIDVRPYSC